MPIDHQVDHAVEMLRQQRGNDGFIQRIGLAKMQIWGSAACGILQGNNGDIIASVGQLFDKVGADGAGAAQD